MIESRPVEGVPPQEKVTKAREDLQKMEKDLQQLAAVAARAESAEIINQLGSILPGLRQDVENLKLSISDAETERDSSIEDKGKDYETKRRKAFEALAQLSIARDELYEPIGEYKETDKSSYTEMMGKFDELFPSQAH